MNPTPSLRLTGTVHGVSERHVSAQPATDAERDETGRIVRAARDAREAYDVYDVTVLSEPAGYLTVLLRADHLEGLGGQVPAPGDRVEGWPVRSYVSWQGQPPRRYTVVGYSVAGDVLVAEYAAKVKGSRALSATG